MNKNELFAYAVIFILAAGITFGLWHRLKATQHTQDQTPAQSIPAEYQADYMAAKALHQEWMAYPSWRRQAEIQEWCYESFDVPLPVVRRADPLMGMWIEGMRQDYMFTKQIWEIDELRRVK